jgi:hypothetical protein
MFSDVQSLRRGNPEEWIKSDKKLGGGMNASDVRTDVQRGSHVRIVLPGQISNPMHAI